MTQFYISSLIIVFVVVPLILLLFRVLFKKSILYIISVSVVLNSMVAAISGMLVGFTGNLWIIPVAAIVYTITLYLGIQFLKTKVGKPLTNMTENIEQLSKGFFSVQFDAEIAKKNHELGYINKALINMLANLKESISIAELVSQGKIHSATIDFEKNDKHGDLDIALKRMIHQLALTVNNISERSGAISLGSEEINKSSQIVAQGATEQASSLEEISSSVEQMTGNINQNAENAQGAEEIASQTTIKMQSVKSSSDATFDAIKDIAEKIQVINEISDKTNLLAINAAVEAARAGEQGKGFAVVATEVRKLAERSRNSAETIIELTKKCVKEAENSGLLLDELTPGMQKAFNLIQEISSGSAEQRAGVEQINAALAQLNQATQQYASSAEELASSADNFNAQALHLKKDVAFFKLSEENEQQFSKGKILDQIERLKSILDATEEVSKNTPTNSMLTNEPGSKISSPKESGPTIHLDNDDDIEIPEENFTIGIKNHSVNGNTEE
ncbi:methyl-accepting chemotaxis protein [Flammeovirgaceae bacterium SG7u.111]|nr:methyl-accepting chemotaxis protein [Flammeovirgaceae bacterium SG7u.132]WPO34329.1 methyl-accepting chemotaxis protein [Flammeovirgaceae bacterium SG7u.111]